ncbi:unnamed protein product [Porites evermanni]|uniref:Uncharacterized protein n=1 Tax=Porites evermanni TaxID=104178 RepID=A0ABN8RVY2_9CNID|nr:unnamed protein product [Porites evermanni]
MLPKGCEKLLVRFNPASKDPLPNLNSKQDLMGEWRKYFAKLLNTPPVSSTVDIPPMEIDLPIKTGDYTRTEGQAFDSIARLVMFPILRYYGVPDNVKKSWSLYSGTKSAVLVDGEMSGEKNCPARRHPSSLPICHCF